MGVRRWYKAQEPDLVGIKLGRVASGGYDQNLVKYVCSNYAQTRRNVIARTFNTWGGSAFGGHSYNDTYHLIDIPAAARVIRPGTLDVWVYYVLSSGSAENKVDCIAALGSDWAREELTSTTAAWQKISIDMSSSYSFSTLDRLKVSFRGSGANTLVVYAVSAYQPSISSAPTWTDLDDSVCYLGDDDYCYDVFLMKLLRDNAVACRYCKTMRNNVYNQWYGAHFKTDTDYGATNDELGSYKFSKRKDISQIKCHFIAYKSGIGTAKVRLELTGTDNPPSEGAAQETTVTATTAAWHTVTWTLTGNDIADEQDCGLLVDAKYIGASTDIYVPGLSVVEVTPSSSISHTVPDPEVAGMQSAIVSSEVDNARTTLSHLWYYGGRSIMASDWRLADATTMQALCKDSAYNKADVGIDGSVVCRALLYSSTASKRLRVTFGYQTTAGETYKKHIQIQTSEVLATHTDWIDVYRRHETAANGDHIFYEPVDGSDGRTYYAVEQAYLDIRAADQEEHYDGANEPPQIFIQCIAENTGEYIIPLWITVEEVELNPHEFP